MEKKIKKEIGWFSLSRLFWKEQMIFTFLCIASCFINQFIDSNTIAKIVGGSEQKINWDIGIPTTGWKFWKVKYEDPIIVAFIMVPIIIFYSIIVFFHIYYNSWLNSKITRFLKKKVYDKLQILKDPEKEEKNSLALLYEHIDNFSEYVFCIVNQTIYVSLSLICSYFSIWRLTKLWWTPLLGLSFVVIIVFFYCLFQKKTHEKELLFRPKQNRMIDKEDFLVKKNILIIKKGLTEYYKKDYQNSMEITYSAANSKSRWATAASVFPNYLLSQVIFFIISCFIEKKDENFKEALLKGSSIISAGKKFIERTLNFPVYLAAKKQINDFLTREERNDIQKNVFITENIQQISLENLGFFYKKEKWVFQDLNLTFEKGKVNRIVGKNGFGKSTIINLIFGLLKAQKGKIMVNGKYNFEDLNFVDWRKKIAYSEHENLLESANLSTGQKQLKDIQETFTNLKDRDILIFDEADNALDKENKLKIYEEIEKISKDKLVIYISH